jgi:hypothetical protein
MIASLFLEDNAVDFHPIPKLTIEQFTTAWKQSIVDENASGQEVLIN